MPTSTRRDNLFLRKSPANSILPVGADAHIGPAKRTVFTEIFRKSVIAQWVDVGIDPYESTGENTEIR